MDGCSAPKCHEAMNLKIKGKVSHDDFNALKTCTAKKATKKALWIGFVAVGLPLFGIGAGVWSQQESDHLRYAEKEDMVKIQVVVEHLSKDIKEMKRAINKAQEKAQKDREEMLRLLRER